MTKTCTKCGKEKILRDYRESRGECHTCELIYKKQYRAANKAKIKAYDEEYRATHREETIARCVKYDKEQAHKRQVWREANKDMIANNTARYRATKYQATPSWADLDVIAAIYTKAADMLDSITKYHVDHIYPLRSDWVCGLHVENNLQILTAHDNQSKGNRRI